MLHAKDLMIGDYVGYLPTWENEDGTIQREGNSNNPTICEVKGLDGSGAHLDNGEDYFYFWADDIELYPIPLTPEILEKNGFHYNDLPFVQSWEQFGLSLYLGGDGCRINCGQNVAMVIDSVHQLQHALRLLGIEKEIKI